MKKLVIDIETVGTPWEEHDAYVREYLIRGKTDEEAEEEKGRVALSPFTGHIVTIGMVNADTGRSIVLYEVPGQADVITREETNRTVITGSEKHILEKFWDYLEKGDRIITFNGRGFDAPYLMIRSAIHGIVPKQDLTGNRGRFHPNCDLREVLNFNGAATRSMRFNLDLACKTFGVTSSKSEGMDGSKVQSLYEAGRYEDIAAYCLEDVRATAELYRKLEKTLLVLDPAIRETEEKSRERKSDGEQTSFIPTSESAFRESVEQTSKTLTASLDQIDIETSETEGVLTAKQQALVLEKLAGCAPDADDDVPSGI